MQRLNTSMGSPSSLMRVDVEIRRKQERDKLINKRRGIPEKIYTLMSHIDSADKQKDKLIKERDIAKATRLAQALAQNKSTEHLVTDYNRKISELGKKIKCLEKDLAEDDWWSETHDEKKKRDKEAMKARNMAAMLDSK